MVGLNMSNVFLLNLPIQYYIQSHFAEYKVYNPPLGIISIGTWLKFNGVNVKMVDLCHIRLSKDELINEIKLFNTSLLCITVYTENFEMGISFSKYIKKFIPDLKILLGGPHASLSFKSCIDNPYVDFVSRKEGESSILELATAIESNEQRIKYEQIEGIVFKRNNTIVVNKLASPIENLDLLPIQMRELAGIERFREVINISTSRGCPGRCIYCAATAISGATYRVRNIENVFLELVLLKHIFGNTVSLYYIIDDTFTAVKTRITKFVDLINKYNFNIYWQCESRIDIMTEDLLEKMAKAGCFSIQYGIESGSQEVLDKINKGIDLQYAKKIIKATYDNKIQLTLSFMLGHFCDTKETMHQTVEFIKEIANTYRAEIALSFNTPFPGTWQYTHMKDIGIDLKTKKFSELTLLNPVVETKNFTLNDQRKAYFEASDYIGLLTKLQAQINQLQEMDKKGE